MGSLVDHLHLHIGPRLLCFPLQHACLYCPLVLWQAVLVTDLLIVIPATWQAHHCIVSPYLYVHMSLPLRLW